MDKKKVLIIGGGGAGIMAAISAAKAGAEPVILEKNPKLGRKVLIAGAGRCNITNDQLDPSFYNPEGRELLIGVLNRFGKKESLDFFRELGLITYVAPDGRIFPLTNQAISVMDVLKNELERLEVSIQLNVDINNIHAKQKGFEVKTQSGETILGDRVILCCGGKSFPALGADGKGYSMAASFGHTIIDPVPATVALVVKDPWCHPLQGQKIRGRVASRVGSTMGEWVEGDVLFTKYGLSGTAILDASDVLSIASNRHHNSDISVVVDLVPFMTEEELLEEFQRKVKKGLTGDALLAGILPPKFAGPLKEYLYPEKIKKLAAFLKQRPFSVESTRGWNEAEFTSGGVDINEVDSQTLESKKQKGLYLAGEILDVQARRGGYNLAWAWASGHITGIASATD